MKLMMIFVLNIWWTYNRSPLVYRKDRESLKDETAALAKKAQASLRNYTDA